jgi:eukaryotic-like serine/threonine-protein kinase
MMTPERYRQVKAVLDHALEIPTSARSSFLDEACGDDSELRKEVASLLASAAREEADSLLEKSPALLSSFAPPNVESPEDSALIAQLSAAFRDRYIIERELGGGGMSRVFLAFEPALRRHIVIKVLKSAPNQHLSAERFAREVLVTAQLQQANIVQVLTTGEIDGLAYYTMPYVRGESLRERLVSLGKPMPAAEAFDILKSVAKALAFAHAAGVVHRDIKPENVLLSGGTAVVTDFGIAKAISTAISHPEESSRDDTLTAVGAAMGTPQYMAPEQATADRNVGAPADVYSFGVVAYELLAGVHPFAGKRGFREWMAAHVIEQPRPLAERRPDLRPGFTSVVMRCLAKPVGERFADGAELLAALESAPSSSFGITLEDAPRWEVGIPSVAVLPLVNLSADAENEHFSDGIAVEILNALTQMRGIRVAAHTSSFVFKNQNVDLRTIAQRLGVLNVLEGTVRRLDNRVRIGVQLVSAADGMTLWSGRYDRDLADVLAVQDEIAQSIAVALHQTLANGEKTGTVFTAATRTVSSAVSAEVSELCSRGRLLVELRSEGMHEAFRCFEEALRREPDFAPAHAGMAYALTEFGIYHALRPRDAFLRARTAAERALALDPTNALALVMRAHNALWFEWNFQNAEAMARRALELAPGLFLAHDCLGLVLAAQGRFEEAITSLERACTLDPLSEYAAYDLAWVLILAGRWEQAIRELEPAVARHPKASELHRALGFCLLYAGRAGDARVEFTRVLELSVGDRWGTPNLVQPLVALGEITEARRLVGEIEQRAPHEPIPAVGIAIAHHWLGDDDRALAWLEQALEAREYWLVMLRFDPSMARLRQDPRFQAVMQRVTAESIA